MTTLLVQDYLRTKGLAALEAEHSIQVKRHQAYPNLVLLKYNQIETVMGPLTRECRGLILDELRNWECVCYTYARFPNLNGETWGDVVDYSTARVMEKLDGSICQLYYYDGDWRVSTSGTPDASGEVGDHKLMFKSLFWRTWNELGYCKPARTDCCYAFELCSPLNALVVKYKESRVVLHGVRCLSDFGELDPTLIAAQNGWECVKSWPLSSSIDELIAQANALNPLEAEGYVLCDSAFHRVKVKSKDHVMLSRIRDNLTSSHRNIIEVIRSGEGAEYISSFPEIKAVYDKLKAKYEGLVGRIEGTYAALKDQPTQKDFAGLAIKFKYSGALFAMRKGTSARQFLAQMTVKSLEEWLDE